MPVEIKYDDLKEKVNNGWKKDALAKHYGLNQSQMTKALKQCNLKIRRFHKPSFVIIGKPEKKEFHEIEESNATTAELLDVTFEEIKSDDLKPNWE